MSDIEDIYAERSASVGKGGGIHQKVEAKRTIGVESSRFDRRKFSYDKYAAARGELVGWHVSKADRMEAVEAGRKLDQIHHIYGLKSEAPSILEAFDKGLFFAHTLNSGSTLQPQRSFVTLSMDSGAFRTFDMSEVMTSLGVDLRRFFRAFADDVRVVNQEVLDSYNPGNVESVEKHAWLMEVAYDRGMSRYPSLSHDTADKCFNLEPSERAALAMSKVGVFANIVNVADSIHSNARVKSEDSAMSVADRK